MDLRGTENEAYLTIDLGGTFVKSAIMDSEGKVFENSFSKDYSYSDSSEEKILNTLKGLIQKGLAYCSNEGLTPKGIGICCPGPFDYVNGVPKMNHKFKNIYGVNLREFIYAIENIPANTTVIFMHDAVAALQGEIWKGNGKEFKSVAVVTIGTGLGFAFSKDGEVQCAESGKPLLSIYKLPHGRGILENRVSREGIRELFQKNSGATQKAPDVSVIGELADKGDAHAIATFNEVGKTLGSAILEIINEYKIECLLLGGGISHSFTHIKEALVNELKAASCLKNISEVYNIETAPLMGVLYNLVWWQSNGTNGFSVRDAGHRELNSGIQYSERNQREIH